MALIEVRDLHVRLGESHVLQGVEFDVAEGGVTALLGRNGVGKTTTLRALMGLVDRARAASRSTAPTSRTSRHTRSCAAASATSPRTATCSPA